MGDRADEQRVVCERRGIACVENPSAAEHRKHASRAPTRDLARQVFADTFASRSKLFRCVAVEGAAALRAHFAQNFHECAGHYGPGRMSRYRLKTGQSVGSKSASLSS